MKTPNVLMVHSIDVYRPNWSQSGGAKYADSYTLILSQQPCNLQNSVGEGASSQIINDYKQRDQQVKAVAYLLDKAAFDSVNVSDRVTFQSENFRIIGKIDMLYMGKVFRLDLASEVA